MLFVIAAALAGGAPAALSEPVWMETEALAPRICVSMLPGAGRFKSKDAEAWAEIRKNLEQGRIATALLASQRVKKHPAQRTMKGAAYLLGTGIAIDLEPLISKYPDDPCLRVMAASMALKQGDPDGVSRHLKVAMELWPDNEDLASMSVMMGGEDWKERAEEALKARPEDIRLRYTIAQLAEGHGELQMAVDSYRAIYAAGEEGVADKLAALALRTGDVGAYLQVVAPKHPVQVEGVSKADAIGPAYMEWLGLKEGERLRAVIRTTMGELHCILDHENAPMTVMNFVGLARGDVRWTHDGEVMDRPLYDGTILHRVIPNFMIQMGDPEGTGRGNPGYRFADEPSPRGALDRPGVLAMANSGKDTNGSQFFITEVATPHLSGKHTVFGSCDDSTVRLVKRIARVKTDAAGRPEENVVLEGIDFEVVSTP